MAAPQHNSMPTRLAAFTALSDWCVLPGCWENRWTRFATATPASSPRPWGGTLATLRSVRNVWARGTTAVLFSFKALRECPVHRTEFWCIEMAIKSIPSPKLFNELLKPYVRYGREQQVSGICHGTFAPKANAQRDGALGEIADWLMDIGLRYWIGNARGPHVSDVPFARLRTNALSTSRLAMGLAGAEPSWVDCQVTDLPARSCNYGDRQVRDHESVSEVPSMTRIDRGGNRRNIDLNLYYKTLLCDFKAIHRYIKHQIPAKARRWLARLSVAVDAPDNGALLQMGGPNAWTAWAIVLWWRAVRAHGFDSKASLVCRPYWLALDPAIPTWGDKSRPNPSLAPVPDFAHIWLVRWISAAGLLRFWCSVRDVVAHQSHHQPCSHVTFETSYNEIRSRTGVLESAQTDVLTLCFSQWRRPMHWFTQEHFYEKPRNVFMQMDAYKLESDCFRSINITVMIIRIIMTLSTAIKSAKRPKSVENGLLQVGQCPGDLGAFRA
jgi:hypothetical protein